MKLITDFGSKNALLVAVGLGTPKPKEWVNSIEEGVEVATDWIKENPTEPAYIMRVEKQLQGTVSVFEVGTAA